MPLPSLRRTPSRRAGRRALAAGVAAFIAAAGLAVPSAAVGHEVTPLSLWSTEVPRVSSASDGQAVELGVRFSTDVSGDVLGVRFYKGAGNTGTHTGSLWTSGGKRLARAVFSGETATGWQSVRFAEPVPVDAGRTYVASYHTRVGRYAADHYAFTSARTVGPLTAPAGKNGVYRYGSGGFPDQSYRSTNYYVDVLFAPDPAPAAPAPSTSPTVAPPPTAEPTAQPSPSVSPTATAPVSSTTPTASPIATTSPSPTSAPSTPSTSADPLANLPRVPWEGGPAYYKQFPSLANTEWTTSSFFPVMYWGAYVNEPDKALNNAAKGINVYGETYAQVADSERWTREAGIHSIGHMLPDEADMWAGYGSAGWTGKWGFQSGVCDTPNVGCAPDMFRKLEAQRNASDGRMRYYNGGKGMMMWMSRDTGAKFVNGETWPVHPVTASMYFYTDGGLHGGDPAYAGEATTFFGIPRDQVHRAANYGEAAMVRLRDLDARDGKRQPLGALVELGQQTGTTNPSALEFATMNPDKIEGAVWSTLIHEARMVGYFSHSFGTQPTSDALNHPAGNAHYDAVKRRVTAINGKVKTLAPVLNTQSYDWTFNSGLSTMLKQHGGEVYVFAMQKRQNTSGTYSFVLPPGVTGTVQVVGENRTLPILNGTFQDSFAAEHTHHVYRITP